MTASAASSTSKFIDPSSDVKVLMLWSNDLTPTEIYFKRRKPPRYTQSQHNSIPKTMSVDAPDWDLGLPFISNRASGFSRGFLLYLSSSLTFVCCSCLALDASNSEYHNKFVADAKSSPICSRFCLPKVSLSLSFAARIPFYPSGILPRKFFPPMWKAWLEAS